MPIRGHMIYRFFVVFGLLITLLSCSGNQTAELSNKFKPNYTKPLTKGKFALTKLSRADWPNLASAWEQKDLFLQDAIDNSIGWFDVPSSKQWFPIEGITHNQAKASVIAFRQLLLDANTKEEFIAILEEQFNVYSSVGCDDKGTVLFTGYYSPDFKASATQSIDYRAPLYQRPTDLVTDPDTGAPLGRQEDNGKITTWPTRLEIETKNLLGGTELVWLQDHLDTYIIHVNGSARLRMNNGEIKYIGYAGKTDRPYKGLGETILEKGLLPSDKLSLRAIRRMYDKNPSQIKLLINQNESYVFFQEYDGSNWPAGSLGVPVTAKRSIATDKKIFPRGGIVLVDTKIKSLTGDKKPFVQFMVDQDTGGAIRAPGRCDLFMGIGATAGIKAGNQYAEGKLYYLFLKPDSVALIQP